MVENTIQYLGRMARDKITGAEGPITSVCFDLFGCVQACMERGYDKEGKKLDNYWFDVQRLVLSGERLMPVPSFSAEADEPIRYERGAADKPMK